MRILVTGAAGFIGSHLAKNLVLNNHDVVGVDSLNDYYSPSLKIARIESMLRPYGVNIITGNISDVHFVKKIFEEYQPECVFHLAAQAGVRLPISKFSSYIENNVIGFSNILTSIIEDETPYLFYASSSSVYGNSTKVSFSENEKFLQPTSFYGGTKLSNEILIEAIKDKVTTSFIGLRFFTVYGKWGRPDMSYFRIVNSILNDRPFTLYGDGSVQRDFTYIDDVIESVIRIMKVFLKSKGGSEIFNIGGGRPQSMRELIDIANELSGKKLKIINVNRNINDVAITSANYQKLLKFTDYVPSIELKVGLERIFAWAKEGSVKRKLEEWVASSN